MENDNGDKGLDEICEALDDLIIENLELIEEKVLVTVQLEKLLRQGHLELAKARYIRGKESIGLLQIPSEDSVMESLFNLETEYVTSEKDESIKVPHFDISLKRAKNADEKREREREQEREQEQEQEREQEQEQEREPRNPINWFGVLVPQSLKFAQKHFQNAVYLSVKLANIQSQLAKTLDETTAYKLLKKDAT